MWNWVSFSGVWLLYKWCHWTKLPSHHFLSGRKQICTKITKKKFLQYHENNFSCSTMLLVMLPATSSGRYPYCSKVLVIKMFWVQRWMCLWIRFSSWHGCCHLVSSYIFRASEERRRLGPRWTSLSCSTSSWGTVGCMSTSPLALLM